MDNNGNEMDANAPDTIHYQARQKNLVKEILLKLSNVNTFVAADFKEKCVMLQKALEGRIVSEGDRDGYLIAGTPVLGILSADEIAEYVEAELTKEL